MITDRQALDIIFQAIIAEDVVKLNLEEQAKYVKLGIMDFTGKVLATQDLNVNEGTVPVNLANYPAGTYFFTVKTDKAFRTEKIVKF